MIWYYQCQALLPPPGDTWEFVSARITLPSSGDLKLWYL